MMASQRALIPLSGCFLMFAVGYKVTYQVRKKDTSKVRLGLLGMLEASFC